MNFFEQLKEDWIAHGKDWTRPGFRAVTICRFGQWKMNIKSRWLRAPLSVFHRMLFRRASTLYGIELPYTVKLGRRVVFEHQGAIIIHGRAEIGDDCVIRQGVSLGNRYLDRPCEAPVLGKGVNVGAGAKLLGKVTVGDGASIGANAVVVSDVAPGTTVVGIPAKPINASANDMTLAPTPPLRDVS